ncbi:transposase [Pseudomonas aeruginosa]|uniref:transposase n=1 Tax=Pseudomonas aeruginosa TaxID=287 RepID=UPI0009A5D243|nr:transposase [Pseudomonas aeruginosa]MCT2415646.1 transposase [Pseudomonas aeruginosa]RTU08941.1 hypothetical protein DY968_28830 [Pseudomonas aeruginosa]HBN9706127.1 transposase [Pseudomonas aeruginosa]HBN9725011.1 transposase [Pseudomonas aeruginosa]HBN9768114.1 transposase [Pseudomonas aeruginosa]
MSERKSYSPEFKREAIEQIRRSGANCRQVVQEIAVAPNLLTRWVRESQSGAEKAFRKILSQDQPSRRTPTMHQTLDLLAGAH